MIRYGLYSKIFILHNNKEIRPENGVISNSQKLSRLAKIHPIMDTYCALIGSRAVL